ncbi:MAG: AMP-binding protein [Lachnospiraceae bacterium]|jgi:long-chain acyl-CoA synthetase|nr:AMP-binding protein [Lachnospiraceae bacterium]MEE3461121.1 AMP-binding protein [Lachnospiraceae bacterium]
MWNLLKYEDNTAVIDDYGHTLSYRDLSDAGKELCEKIADENGGDARCLVFNMCNNVLGSLIGYISFINGRIVPAMLKHELDEELLANLYNEYEPAYIWCSEEDRKRPLFKDLPSAYGNFGYVLLKTPFGTKTKLYEELALLLTTSGSTGSPKFVRQSYKNIRANTDSIVEYLKLDSTERPVTDLPMNYTYGISIINTHIDVGAAILLTDKTLMQREFWNFFRTNHATSIAGVPYTYEMLKRLRFMRMDLPDLRTMTQAGGKILPELHKEFASYAVENHKNFVVMYGACEATARMGWLPPEKALEKQGAMGIAIPGGRLELIDVDDRPFDEPDKVGELVYYGDNVTLGYALSAADLIKGDERHGRYVTGDMAKKDKDGYFYIVGRKKRFLKIYGNRVNLDDCERMLKQTFNADCACGGVDDRMYIFGPDEDLLPKMKEFLSGKTGLNPAAFTTMTLDHIPHNESGKTLYKELAKYYA